MPNCLLLLISCFPIWIQAKHTILKIVYSTLSDGWPYTGITRWCLLWCFLLDCVYAPPAACVVIAISPRMNLNHDGKQGQLIYWKVMTGSKKVIMWPLNCAQIASKQATIEFTSTARCRCHAGTDIRRPHGHTLHINQVVRTIRHWVCGRAPTIYTLAIWCTNKKLVNQSLSLSCLSHRCFQWYERQHAFRAEPRLKKSISAIVFQVFWNYENTRIANLWLSDNFSQRSRYITHIRILLPHTQVWYNAL